MLRGISVREFATRSNSTVETVRRWIHSQKIKALKHPLSNRYFIPESELEKVHPQEVVPSTEAKGE